MSIQTNSAPANATSAARIEEPYSSAPDADGEEPMVPELPLPLPPPLDPDPDPDPEPDPDPDPEPEPEPEPPVGRERPPVLVAGDDLYRLVPLSIVWSV
jgi:hypothetical protein